MTEIKSPLEDLPEPVGLANVFGHLLSSSKYSDLTIHGKNQRWTLQSAVVFSRVPYLESISRKGGKRSYIIDPSEDRDDVTDAIVNWIYRDTYSIDPNDSLTPKPAEEPTGTPEEPIKELQFHAAIFVSASRLKLLQLQNLAISKFKQLSEETWDANDFCSAAELLWNLTEGNQEFKDTIIGIANSRVHELLECEKFERLSSTRPEIGFAVLRAFAASTKQDKLTNDVSKSNGSSKVELELDSEPLPEDMPIDEPAPYLSDVKLSDDMVGDEWAFTTAKKNKRKGTQKTNGFSWN